MKTIIVRAGKKLYRVKVRKLRRNPTNIRQGPPRVIRLPAHYYAVYDKGHTKWCIVGTPYGYLHRTDGMIRVWKTRSGAAKHLSKYRARG